MRNNRILSIIEVFLFLNLLAPAALAAWKVHSSWSLKGGNGWPVTMSTNATSTSAGDVWIGDFSAKRVFHYSPAGVYQDNFSVSTYGNGWIRSIWVNNTLDNGSKILITEDSDTQIWGLNSTGSNVMNITITSGTLVDAQGLTSGLDSYLNTSFCVMDTTSKKLIQLNSSGKEVSACSVGSYATSTATGLSTNSTSAVPTLFWTCDSGIDKCFKIDQNCVLKETIDVGELGITYPNDIETYYRQTSVSDLLVVSETEQKVFRLTYSDTIPGSSGVTESSKYTLFTNVSYLAATCLDDIDTAYAYLATNETGTWANHTGGKYGSPITFAGGANTSVLANFTWQNKLTNENAPNVSVSWKIGCVDNGGQWNYTLSSTINATPLRLKCYNASQGIYNVSIKNSQNVTFFFNSSSASTCAFFMPPRSNLTRNLSCSYKASGASKVYTYNDSIFDCIVNATYLNLTGNSSSIIEPAEALKLEFPPNLPVTIAAASAVAILYIISVVSRKRRSE